MTQYIRRKSLLNKSGVEWADYNCNHYVGCAHNCTYPCYARILSKKKEYEWVRVKVVENALELAVKQIKRIPTGSRIMVSSFTDPYQLIERTEKLTRSLIPVLGSREDVKTIIITKSDLVIRDFELIKQFPSMALCMTITSAENLPQFEPNAPGNMSRIQCLEQAHDLGIYTIASVEPWIPGVTNLWEIARLIHPYVKEVIIGSWNYKFRRCSTSHRKLIAHYQGVLPSVVDFLHSHMKRVLVKDELLKLVDLPKAESQLERCVKDAENGTSSSVDACIGKGDDSR